MLRSEKLQRLTAMSVSALLAANALVLVVGLGDDLAGNDPAADANESETVTFIVQEDGSRVAVDPESPEGWRAIADAQERGQEVVTVAEPVPADNTTQTTVRRSTTTTTTTKPRTSTPVAPTGAGGSLRDVEELVDGTLNTVVSTVEQVTETVDQTVDQVTDVVDDTTGLDTGSTVDPVVDAVTDTVDQTVGGVVETITQQTLPPVTTPPLTAPPVLGGLGGLGG